MHDIDLILMLAAGFGAALILGYITHRLHLSPIVGYLLAGVLIGPQTPGFHADAVMAEQLAEVGVILLMFGVGLHFDLKDLLAVRRVAVPGAVLQSAFATVLGALAATALGWSWTAGLVFGLCLSVASTVVLIRVLSDGNELHTQTGHIAVGWLIVEDIFTVVVLVLLPAMFAGAVGTDTGAERPSVAWALLVTLAKVAVLGVVLFTAGARLIPWLMARVARTKSRELFTLSVLAIALGIAVGSTLAFGVSMALGAFLAGMIVGRSDYSSRAAAEALPLRDAFAVLFFVSIGMLFDPRALWEAPALAAMAFAVVVIGKPLIAAVVTRAMGYGLAVTVPVAAALSQIGEFSFILARAGQDLGVLPPEAGNVIIAVAIGSIVINPLIYRAGKPFIRWAAARPAVWRVLNGPEVREHDDQKGQPDSGAAHRAVVIGYGPSGRTFARLLKENGVTPTIVELSLGNARAAREDGFRAIYGDATNQTILEEAGVAAADTIVLTSAGMEHSEDTIRAARELNDDIHVMARAMYIRHVPSLRDAGADAVFSGEAEVALAMTEAMMTRLGATPEQIDRERARVREEIKN
ncbi:MAG TPA: cation:proton antiporter [Vicinamibacterales bacterium]|nr:cation:proton antiporter [Vicinamibacterales bacterium]